MDDGWWAGSKRLWHWDRVTLVLSAASARPTGCELEGAHRPPLSCVWVFLTLRPASPPSLSKQRRSIRLDGHSKHNPPVRRGRQEGCFVPL
jgi:hypothetical protein